MNWSQTTRSLLLSALALGALPLLAGPPASLAQDPQPELTGSIEPSIAILPLWDRSARSAPIDIIEEDLRVKLGFLGFSVMSPELVEQFMERHRIRFTGGISGAQAEALRRETGADWALLTSVDLYQEANPPKLGLTARLVTTTREPRIVWMDSAVRSGDQSPGILGLGLIESFSPIQEKVTRKLVDSLATIEASSAVRQRGGRSHKPQTSRRFRPKSYFDSPDFPTLRDQADQIAVLPLSNNSLSRYAGEILTDQIIRHLVRAGAAVIEPGVVRQVLLETAQIYHKGPSTPDTDILRIDLRADLAVYGEVVGYGETGPANPYPVIDFGLQVVDTRTREVIWSSISYSKGGDGVYFFDVGSVATAQDLASKMAQALINRAAE